MKKNVFIVTVCAMLLALCAPVAAQPPKKFPSIGFLAATKGPSVEAFQQGLRQLGYFEGKNILIHYRYTEGKDDLIPNLVAELVQLKVDVFVSLQSPAIRVAKQTAKTLPTVMVIVDDPVAVGLIDNLARQGGNITGLTRRTTELTGKRLELLNEMIPSISRVGVILIVGSALFKEYEDAARLLKIPLQSIEVRNENPDFEGAFQAAIKGSVTAVIVGRGGVLVRYAKRIADLAIKERLPLMAGGSDFAEAGALASYATNDAEIFKRAAVYVDKILKGAKPADLPVEQPMKFELVINLNAAKQMGLTIPSHVLLRADRVIK